MEPSKGSYLLGVRGGRKSKRKTCTFCNGGGHTSKSCPKMAQLLMTGLRRTHSVEVLQAVASPMSKKGYTRPLKLTGVRRVFTPQRPLLKSQNAFTSRVGSKRKRSATQQRAWEEKNRERKHRNEIRRESRRPPRRPLPQNGQRSPVVQAWKKIRLLGLTKQSANETLRRNALSCPKCTTGRVRRVGTSSPKWVKNLLEKTGRDMTKQIYYCCQRCRNFFAATRFTCLPAMKYSCGLVPLAEFLHSYFTADRPLLQKHISDAGVARGRSLSALFKALLQAEVGNHQ